MSFQEALEYIDILSDYRFEWFNCYDTCLKLVAIDNALLPVVIKRAGINLSDLMNLSCDRCISLVPLVAKLLNGQQLLTFVVWRNTITQKRTR